ncbi:hypothetical protein FNH05_33145 [Amycolatopsis rhizosphaerae]|uniref:Uncharacterized protein n=1 Tax=Amycolatopsis rhizosphaerae TaxID=2053003 RepID=A0A558AG03_9PSEU|nr:hypothetical protein [Amycolatopsis rhizosphaerae]TVT23198.1 hypothetical protein FNH05_33145 [Amycolatopsis rhizosphaerae]
MPTALWTGRHAVEEEVSADIARTLGNELGLAAAPAAMTLSAASTGVPAGSLLPPRERFSGMPAPTHCFVYVDAPTPRPFELRAAIMSGRTAIRRALGLGTLLYAVPLSLPAPARVALGRAGGSGPTPFEGDPVVAGRLNADAQLVENANALAATTAGQRKQIISAPGVTYDRTWAVERLLAIEPLPQGPVLLVRTLHRATTRGWTLRAAAVLDLATRVETALRTVRA